MEVDLGPGLFPVAERLDGAEGDLCCCGISCSSGACCCHLDTQEMACLATEAAERASQPGVQGLSLQALADAAARFSNLAQDTALVAAVPSIARLQTSNSPAQATHPVQEQDDSKSQKQCTRCKRALPRSSFCENKRSADGLYTQCRSCVAEKDRERRQRLKQAARPAAASKTCARCKAHKPQSAFYSDPARPDGLQTYCKPCFSAAYKEKRERGRQQGLAGADAIGSAA